MVVENHGKTPIRLAADGRLVWLEVVPPAQTFSEARSKAHGRALKSQAMKPGSLPVCKAPSSMRPKVVPESRALVLKPGERYEEKIDPIVLCGNGKAAAALREGAVVYAHYGWPSRRRFAWQAHKHSAPKPPFVVDSLKNPRDSKPIRSLDALPFVLTQQPTEKPRHGVMANNLQPSDRGTLVDQRAARLLLTTQPRIDSANGRNIAVHASLKNEGLRSAVIHVRRDDFAFTVVPPDENQVECGPGPDLRGTARDFFTTLSAGRKKSFTIMLGELCPPNTFRRPGGYRIFTRVLMRHDASHVKLQSFQGTIHAGKPIELRVRSGPLPYHDRPPAVANPPEINDN
jgi:hypothetical protein